MPLQREDQLHLAVANYLKANYPSVIFRTDFAAGIKMTKGQAVKHSRMQYGKSYPDLWIAQPWPTPRTFKYLGCYIELKTEEAHNQPYLKDGSPGMAKNIVAQRKVLDKLTELGYYARFAVGFAQAIAIIDWYLEQDTTKAEPTPEFFTFKEDSKPYEIF